MQTVFNKVPKSTAINLLKNTRSRALTNIAQNTLYKQDVIDKSLYKTNLKRNIFTIQKNEFKEPDKQIKLEIKPEININKKDIKKSFIYIPTKELTVLEKLKENVNNFMKENINEKIQKLKNFKLLLNKLLTSKNLKNKYYGIIITILIGLSLKNYDENKFLELIDFFSIFKFSFTQGIEEENEEKKEIYNIKNKEEYDKLISIKTELVKNLNFIDDEEIKEEMLNYIEKIDILLKEEDNLLLTQDENKLLLSYQNIKLELRELKKEYDDTKNEILKINKNINNFIKNNYDNKYDNIDFNQIINERNAFENQLKIETSEEQINIIIKKLQNINKKYNLNENFNNEKLGNINLVKKYKKLENEYISKDKDYENLKNKIEFSSKDKSLNYNDLDIINDITKFNNYKKNLEKQSDNYNDELNQKLSEYEKEILNQIDKIKRIDQKLGDKFTIFTEGIKKSDINSFLEKYYNSKYENINFEKIINKFDTIEILKNQFDKINKKYNLNPKENIDNIKLALNYKKAIDEFEKNNIPNKKIEEYEKQIIKEYKQNLMPYLMKPFEIIPDNKYTKKENINNFLKKYYNPKFQNLDVDINEIFEEHNKIKEELKKQRDDIKNFKNKYNLNLKDIENIKLAVEYKKTIKELDKINNLNTIKKSIIDNISNNTKKINQTIKNNEFINNLIKEKKDNIEKIYKSKEKIGIIQNENPELFNKFEELLSKEEENIRKIKFSKNIYNLNENSYKDDNIKLFEKFIDTANKYNLKIYAKNIIEEEINKLKNRIKVFEDIETYNKTKRGKYYVPLIPYINKHTDLVNDANSEIRKIQKRINELNNLINIQEYDYNQNIKYLNDYYKIDSNFKYNFINKLKYYYKTRNITNEKLLELNNQVQTDIVQLVNEREEADIDLYNIKRYQNKLNEKKEIEKEITETKEKDKIFILKNKLEDINSEIKNINPDEIEYNKNRLEKYVDLLTKVINNVKKSDKYIILNKYDELELEKLKIKDKEEYEKVNNNLLKIYDEYENNKLNEKNELYNFYLFDSILNKYNEVKKENNDTKNKKKLNDYLDIITDKYGEYFMYKMIKNKNIIDLNDNIEESLKNINVNYLNNYTDYINKVAKKYDYNIDKNINDEDKIDVKLNNYLNIDNDEFIKYFEEKIENFKKANNINSDLIINEDNLKEKIEMFSKNTKEVFSNKKSENKIDKFRNLIKDGIKFGFITGIKMAVYSKTVFFILYNFLNNIKTNKDLLSTIELNKSISNEPDEINPDIMSKYWQIVMENKDNKTLSSRDIEQLNIFMNQLLILQNYKNNKDKKQGLNQALYNIDNITLKNEDTSIYDIFNYYTNKCLNIFNFDNKKKEPLLLNEEEAVKYITKNLKLPKIIKKRNNIKHIYYNNNTILDNIIYCISKSPKLVYNLFKNIINKPQNKLIRKNIKTLLKDNISPLKQTSPIKQTNPIKQTTPIKQTSPLKQTNPIKQTTPIKQTSPLKQTTPIKQTSPLKQTTPIKQTSPLKQTSPIKQDF